ncbi:hypothetical protein OSB04_014825 [Centaurea solstitialis]|uniref:HMA domain-containing protein n=1 Tax=Centaurea solstitialis TaxID=347529 RepID=A0AA38T9S3_9ASTR|nr:hypothetical protein OSB04_014825 [Centaurea solstitialis]
MPESKKVVLKVDAHGNRDRMKVLHAVSSFLGVESLAMDMNAKKLTVIGDIDPVAVVKILRKRWHTEIVTVGPSKEDDKKKNEPACDVYHHACMTHHSYLHNVEGNPNGCVIC